MEGYDNNICLLDATYKTTRYFIPLYSLVVKTNVDYQIVGFFATQDKTSDTLVEALSVIKLWYLKCFIVDNCEEEITTIEKLFLCK